MKMNGEIEVHLYAFITLATDGGEQSAAPPILPVWTQWLPLPETES
jgi:hypothetical protein